MSDARGAPAALIALGLCAGCGRFGFDPLGTGGGGDGGTDAARDTGTADSADAARTDWWDPRWKRRIKLTFSNVAPSVDNLSVMVRLDAARIDYAATQDQGADVRFVDADGAAVLPHEIEVWNENGASYVWVRVPLIDGTSTSDFMWLYYDNATAAPSANAAVVWGGHALVWHFAESPTGTAPQFRDSTANGNHGTAVGGIAAGAQGPGQIAGSVGLDGNDDWFTAPHSASLELGGDLTISTWVRLGAARSQWLCDFVTPQSEQEMNNHLYELSINSSGRVELHWEYGSGNDENVDSSVPLASPVDTWVMITATRKEMNKSVRFFENGAPLGLARTYTNDPSGGTAATLWVSGELDPSSAKLPLQGRQDELRIVGVVRSPDRIAADYRSMTDAMVGYGATEPY